jgi:hypothetical protein
MRSLLVCFAILAGLTTGCANTSTRGTTTTEGGTTAISVLLADPDKYNDQQVSVGGEVSGAAGAFGGGAYTIDDGTGKLTVITDEGNVPPEGSRVIVQGEFEALYTIGDASGVVLKELQRQAM